MRFIHIADIHASKERKEQAMSVIRKLTEYVEKNSIDFILCAGDFWDSTITNTKASGFNDIASAMYRLNEMCPVKMIYGTPSHEPEGSLDIFATLGIEVHDDISFDSNNKILFVPEPRRSRFIRTTKDETDHAIQEYMERIASYSADIVVLHGDIRGATYQNGAPVSSPIAFSKELLLKTGAKYFACGHIHEPQEVFPNCRYSGSAAPIDFGETHDAGFNDVAFKPNGTVSVKRVSFGFPLNKTVEIEQFMLPELLKKKFPGINLKVKMLSVFQMNKRETENQIKRATDAASCTVVPEYRTSASARAADIIEKKTLAEKLQIYASVNDIKLSKNALKIAHELEESLLIKYVFPTHSFRLLSASIRGAIGISKQQIDLDFSKFSDGVIVMVGQNGAGKTTILENLHPYPCMLTRSGKLRDHFNLRDSHRILVYEDETGKQYKITIQMAAGIKSGVTKYFVETGDGKEWIPVPECDGNLDSYSRYIENTFGSLPLFMRTSFFTDKETNNCPDISRATKSERMELFAKLAGTDYFNALCQTAKERHKELEIQIRDSSMLLGGKETCLRTLERLEAQKSKAQKELEETSRKIEQKKEALKNLRQQNIEYQKYLAKRESDRQLAEQWQNQIDTNLKLIKEVLADKSLAERLEKSQDEIILYRQLCEKEEENQKKALPYMEEYTRRIDKVRQKEKEIDRKEKSVSKLKADIRIIQRDIEYNSIDASEKEIVNCPTCGAELSEEKKEELNVILIEAKKEAVRLSQLLQKTEASLHTAEQKLEALLAQKAEAEAARKEAEIQLAKTQNEGKNTRNSLYRMRCQGINLLAEAKCRWTDHDGNIRKLEEANAYLHGKIKGQGMGSAVKSVEDKLEETEYQLEELQEQDKELTSCIRQWNAEIKSQNKLLDDIISAGKKIEKMRSDFEDYGVLAKAFSNSGIQALELEAVIPGIVAIANDILHRSWGDRFTINFASQHEGATKLIEDFKITAFNSVKNLEENLDNVSAGELVWIKQALYYAFSVSRQNTTGFCFLTRFMDESDGHLDSELRLKYIDMINAAHLAGNARQTVLVTHSQEIKDVAEQIIEV